MRLLDRAFAEVARLPADEQEALAAWILAELAAERQWQDALGRSGEALAALADEALAEHRGRGRRRSTQTGCEVSDHQALPRRVSEPS